MIKEVILSNLTTKELLREFNGAENLTLLEKELIKRLELYADFIRGKYYENDTGC